jgi:hypothetical protein
MSIDVSSLMPVTHQADIQFNKEEEYPVVVPVEESPDSGETGLQLKKQGFEEVNPRNNLISVGDTYSTKGELVKESNTRSNGAGRDKTIDMLV